MNFIRYAIRIKIPTQKYRAFLWAPILGGALYGFSQFQQLAFMEKVRARDFDLKLNAQSIFSEHNMEFSNMIDISNQEPIQSEQFQDYYTVMFAGELSQFKLLQEKIEAQMFNYNLRYLFVTNTNYYDNNKKYLETYLKAFPKKGDLIIAYGSQQSLQSNTIYCIINNKLIYMSEIDDKNMELLARTLSLKLNKDLEKQFVSQIDF